MGIRLAFGLWCASFLARMLKSGSGRRMWLGGLRSEIAGCWEAYADELAGLLETLPVEESRTRWHLGLVVPRVAHTRMQRLRAARTMSLLAEDESNGVRCSAVEGLGLLAMKEASLRDEAEEMVERFLREGTKAMKSRARAVMRLWAGSERRKK